MARLTYDEVKHFVEIVCREKLGQLNLISEEFVSYKEKLIISDNDDMLAFISYRSLKDYLRKNIYIRFFHSNNPYSMQNVQNWLDKYAKGYVLRSREYISMTHKMDFICPEGHSFKMDFHHFKNGKNRCPVCAGRNRTKETLKKEIEKLTKGKITLMGDFSKMHEHTVFKCNDCQHEWNATPNNTVRGHGCPKCNKSKGENKIINYLEQLKLNYETEYMFKEVDRMKKLRFDFKIDNILLEYDGELHFKKFNRKSGEIKLRKTQYNDKIKNQHCINNDIPLIRIPYWEFNNIEYILENVLIHFNLIKKTKSTYNKDLVMKYLVNRDWNQDHYLRMPDLKQVS